MKKIILTLPLILFFFNISWGQDDQRKGFIFGGTLGGGMVTYTETLDSVKSERQNKIALMTELKFGYAANNKLEIIYSHKQAWFEAEYPSTPGPFLDGFSAVTLNTISFTYYLKPQHRTFLIEGGIGYTLIFAPFDDDSFSQWGAFGWGFHVAGGYRFAENLALILDLMYVVSKEKERGRNYKFEGFISQLNVNFTTF